MVLDASKTKMVLDASKTKLVLDASKTKMVLDASKTKMMLVFYGIQNGLVSRDEKFCPINVVKCMIRHYSLLHVYVVNSEMRHKGFN